MEKFNQNTNLNNRYKIKSTIKIDSGSIIYKVEDLRFIGSTWIAHQIDISENTNSSSYLNNLFSLLSFLSKIMYDKIGKIVDFFIEKDYLIVISEDINGILLSELIHKSNPNIVKAIKLGIQLVEIVKFLYEKKIINFVDINPENLIIDKNGTLKVLTFAISKLPTFVSDKGIEENKHVGTLGYIPPEMLEDDKTNIQEYSYIYIICAIIYEYLTKMNPYLRDDPFFFPPLSSLSYPISNQLSLLIEKCLNYNYNNRIKTFKEFEKKLMEILKNETQSEETQKDNLLSFLRNKTFFIIIIFIVLQLVIILAFLIYYFLFL